MKNVNILLMAIFLFVVMSCKQDVIVAPENTTNNVMFSNLQVGQKSNYIYLVGENYYDAENVAFEYTADTLVHEIISADENGFLVKEYLTPGSLVFDSEDPYIYNAWEPYRFYIKVENDSVKFEPHPDYTDFDSKTYVSRNFVLPLADFAENEMEINGWKIAGLSCCESRDGFITKYFLLDNNYDRLNVVIDNAAMAVDGLGMTYFYGKPYGMVRYMTYGGFLNFGIGWDLLRK